MKLVKYRIIKDSYSGFEVQIWKLWFPFWIQCNWVNTHSSIERAKNFIEIHKKKVVYSE